MRIRRPYQAPRHRFQLRVGGQVGSETQLGWPEDLHRRCGHQFPVLAEQGEDDLEIDGVRERAEVDERVRQRVRRVERDGGSAERLDHVDGGVRPVFQLMLPTGALKRPCF